jgi:hypothetical protein
MSWKKKASSLAAEGARGLIYFGREESCSAYLPS